MNKPSEKYATEWIPEGEPRAVLHICCDESKHVTCREELAKYFTLQGFVVVACKSLEQKEMHHCLQKIKSNYADIPHLLIGCSEGAMKVHSFINKYPEAVEGAVLADVEPCMEAVDEKLPVLQVSGISEDCQEVFRHIYRWTEERLDEMLYRAATKY